MKRENATTVVLLVLLPLPVAAAWAGWLWWQRRRKRDQLEELLRRTMRDRIARWARELAAAGVASYPDELGAERWTRGFANLIDRESGGGAFLSPPGPEGLGDHLHGYGLGQVDDRPARPGRSDYEQQLSAQRLAHIASGDWRDPEKHLGFCAAVVLRGAWDELSEIDNVEERFAAALDSYNAGVDNVRRARESGQRSVSITTGGNYSTDILGGRAEVEAA